MRTAIPADCDVPVGRVALACDNCGAFVGTMPDVKSLAKHGPANVRAMLAFLPLDFANAVRASLVRCPSCTFAKE